MNMLEKRLYNNARTLTKLMIMHNLEIIDKEVDLDLEEYFDDFVDVSFIRNGDTILHLFNGERIVFEGLAEQMYKQHYYYTTKSRLEII